jgi:hypothetical protein
MIVLATTWEMQGGQRGYNALGNIFCFGDRTCAGGVILFEFTPRQDYILLENPEAGRQFPGG